MWGLSCVKSPRNRTGRGSHALVIFPKSAFTHFEQHKCLLYVQNNSLTCAQWVLINNNKKVVPQQYMMCAIVTHCAEELEQAEVSGLAVGAQQGSRGGLLLCCLNAGWPVAPPHPSALKQRQSP